MERDDDKWLRDLRDRLDGYEEPAGERLWKAIEDDLPGCRRRRIVGRIVRVAAVAACVVLLGGMYVFLRSVEPSADSTQGLLEVADAGAVDGSYGEGEAVADAAGAGSESVPVAQVPSAWGERSVPAERKKVDGDALADVMAQDADTASNSNPESEQMQPSERNRQEKERIALAGDPSSYRVERVEASRFKAEGESRSWSVALAMGNGFGNQNASEGGFRPIMRQPLFGSQPNDVFVSSYSEIVYNNTEQDTRTDLEYDFPLTYSATVRYRFGKRWGVEAGLGFSRLGMSWKSGSETHYYRSRQKMYFVGVPVGLSFTVYDSRFLSCYVIAGGSVEKCVAGNVKTYLNSDGKYGNPSGKKSLDEHPWQFSVKAGVGMQFNITRTYGIFAEPQVAWYFDNSDSMPLRKGNDPNFHLSVGMRLSY